MSGPGPGFHRAVSGEPYVDFSGGQAPGFGRVSASPESRVKWLGGAEGNGPWIYHVERRRGEVIAPHRHHAARVEYVLEGAIEWHEAEEAIAWYRAGAPEGSGARYGPDTLTWVPAGRVYGYRIVEDTRLLLWFDGPPGGTTWAT